MRTGAGSIVLYSLLTKFTVRVLCVHTTSMHLARFVKCCLTASSLSVTLSSSIYSLYSAPPRWVKHHSHHDKFSKTSSRSLY
ncbi:uncharacterized protein F5147DRAFT_702809 [Suillus discolor]|uniref:Uncharacterized protein n=1 Tax=Suillus discolor TaxID=1912936 RepID=A0A9P7JSF3_9AGAM|nr:uncharacterized protein F5147DRAFT_702809 [Suillus discolor]KAG2105007.1 hypothetical protein F5147DRAFT_702809 [Suillus discolor]